MRTRASLYVAALALVAGALAGPAAAATAVRTFGNGTHRVGNAAGQVKAGNYTATGGASCAWARLGPAGKVLAKGGGRAAQRVTIGAADAQFRTQGCGTWRSVSPPTTTTVRPATTSTTPPATTTTTVRPTTTTTVPVAVWGTVCTPEGATAVTATGEALVCAKRACNGFVARNALWRYARCA